MAEHVIQENTDDSPSIRRSTRVRKPRKIDNEDADFKDKGAAASLSTSRAIRPPKRKAAVAVEKNNPIRYDELLVTAVAPIPDTERVEWLNWVELESDPAFFSVMLQDLGLKDIKVQELFSVDAESLKALPRPVYGLIFLYNYQSSDVTEEDRPECPEDLWFANQTTANACATVGLMNIIMNAKIVELGAGVKEFKEATRSLPPPHRGYMLDKNEFIRGVHNSFARRLDLLAEDLLVDNQFEKHKKRKLAKKAAAGARKKKKISETAYHYIAYVPHGGELWELDGLETKPLCLGEFQDDWTELASTRIMSHVTRAAEVDALSFNLLAICQSPAQGLRDQLASKIRSAAAVDDYAHFQNTLENVKIKGDSYDHLKKSTLFETKYTPAHLSQFDLTLASILSQPIAPSISSQLQLPALAASNSLNTSSGHATDLNALGGDLDTEIRQLQSEYLQEVAVLNEAVEKVRTRREKDYSPAIHIWTRLLAGKRIQQQPPSGADGAEDGEGESVLAALIEQLG